VAVDLIKQVYVKSLVKIWGHVNLISFLLNYFRIISVNISSDTLEVLFHVSVLIFGLILQHFVIFF